MLALTACAAPANTAMATATATGMTLFSTPTLAPTSTVPATSTPLPPTQTATFAPLSVNTSAQVNLRAWPDSTADILDIVLLGAQLTGIARSDDGAWLAVQLPADRSQTGWVSTEFVSVSKEMLQTLPVLVALAPTAIGQQAPPPAGPVSSNATIRNQIFVRSGPGQIYQELGSIAAGTVVKLTGRNETNVWALIEYPSSPTGFGWVATSYLDGADFSYLPYYDNQGNLIPGQTQKLPTTIPASVGQPSATGTPATTYQPAPSDADSRQKPAATVVFSPSQSRSFSFQSQVSSPNGDAEDWISFTPYSPGNVGTYVYLKLECTGNGGITSYLYEQGTEIPADLGLRCGNYGFALKVVGGEQYFLRLAADGSAADIRLVDYILTIGIEP